MALTMQYRAVIKCDVCGKTVVQESLGGPPMVPVPISWIQTAPPGVVQTMEFCSAECLAKWKPDVMPWDEPVPDALKPAEDHREVADATPGAS